MLLPIILNHDNCAKFWKNKWVKYRAALLANYINIIDNIPI